MQEAMKLKEQVLAISSARQLENGSPELMLDPSKEEDMHGNSAPLSLLPPFMFTQRKKRHDDIILPSWIRFLCWFTLSEPRCPHSLNSCYRKRRNQAHLALPIRSNAICNLLSEDPLPQTAHRCLCLFWIRAYVDIRTTSWITDFVICLINWSSILDKVTKRTVHVCFAWKSTPLKVKPLGPLYKGWKAGKWV